MRRFISSLLLNGLRFGPLYGRDIRGRWWDAHLHPCLDRSRLGAASTLELPSFMPRISNHVSVGIAQREGDQRGRQIPEASDVGLIPVPSTTHPRPTALGWLAGRRGVAVVAANSCGLRDRTTGGFRAGFALSGRGSSLVVGRVLVGEVRKHSHVPSTKRVTNQYRPARTVGRGLFRLLRTAEASALGSAMYWRALTKTF
jgi:hypothetical protein